MRAAWDSINRSFSQNPTYFNGSRALSSSEKIAVKKETEFVSVIASSIGKVSFFASWQAEQLECIVPMASVHSVDTISDSRIPFDFSNSSNIVLGKMRGNFFDNHRAVFPDFVHNMQFSKRSVLLVLEGALTVYQKNRIKHLRRGETMVLAHDNIAESDFKVHHPSAYSSENSFFLLLSEAAIKSAALIAAFSSKVEFSLAPDSLFRSKAVTLDTIRLAPSCKTSVFLPGDVSNAHMAENTISVIVCGISSISKSESISARFKATCKVRHIAELESLSLQQTVFFAASRKRSKKFSQGEEKPLRIADFVTKRCSQLEIAGSSSSLNHMHHTVRETQNPFLKKMSRIPLLFEANDGAIPRSPSLNKKHDHVPTDPADMFLPDLDSSTGMMHSSPSRKLELQHAYNEDLKIDFLDKQSHIVTKNTAFWGYTPQLHNPCTNAKFYWALIRLFVHSCQKKVQNLKFTGQPLDTTPLCTTKEEGKHWFKFITVSVTYTLPCNDALVALNPLQQIIMHFAAWHNDFCVQAHFRTAKNIEKLMQRTTTLKCFSCIPEWTRSLIFHRCSFEEWPPGSLILSTLSSEQRMCFLIDGSAVSFSALKTQKDDIILAIKQNDDIAQNYVCGDILSEQNIILTYVQEPPKSEHVYAGLFGAKVLSIPQSSQDQLMKPIWREEMKAKLNCFQSSLLSHGYSESTLIKLLSQCRIITASSHQRLFAFSDSCIYFIMDGCMQVSGSCPMTLNHEGVKDSMKDSFLSSKHGSLVDPTFPPTEQECRLKRKLASSPQVSHSQFKVKFAEIHPPHIFRSCTHHSSRKCSLPKCWKYVSYSCATESKILEVPVSSLPQNNLNDILKSCDQAHTRLWNLFLQAKSFAAPHLDTSSGNASLSLNINSCRIRYKKREKSRIEKLAVPFERHNISQRMCNFNIYSQQDPHQDVLNIAAELKAIQTSRSVVSSTENIKLNRLSALAADISDPCNPKSLGHPLEFNSFVYDVAALANPSILRKEHTELRSISSQPRSSSLKLWSKNIDQMVLPVAEPSKRLLFLAGAEDELAKLSPNEEKEFDEFCAVLNEQSQNPVIRDSRERRKFILKFGDGYVESQAFVQATWKLNIS